MMTMAVLEDDNNINRAQLRAEREDAYRHNWTHGPGIVFGFDTG